MYRAAKSPLASSLSPLFSLSLFARMNIFGSFFISLLAFIIVLGILIFVHEFGHFITAKAFGIRVLKFSLGFGNKLAGWRWGETEYLLSAFPLGGYVKMYGEEAGGEEIPEKDRAYSFSHRPAWQRFLVVFAGPFFNLAFAVLLFFGLFVLVGIPAGEPVENGLIGAVMPDTPAERAGIRAGDTIVAINGQPITSWKQIGEQAQNSEGKTLVLDVRRGEEQLQFRVTPELQPERDLLGEEVGPKRYMLGITIGWKESYEKASVGQCAVAALQYTWRLTYLNAKVLVKMAQGRVSASNMGGPIRIAEFAGERMRAGLKKFLDFMGILSVGLGVLNLLPVPVLDGGHLAFLSFEMLRGKPASERVMDIGQKIGIALLVALMLFVFYNDIAHLIKRWIAS